MYKEKLKLMHELEKLRTQMAIAAIQMDIVYSDTNTHSKELFGAAEMVQDWIVNIRAELPK